MDARRAGMDARRAGMNALAEDRRTAGAAWSRNAWL
jgi:hypothetical protein